jgi:predicted nucleic acid-binding protein
VEPDVVLITDSCVLIDYIRYGKDALMTLATTVRVVVPDVLVADELLDIEASEFLEAGLEIVPVPMELMNDAMSRRRPLSFYDWICFLLAERERWTCVTNDARLKQQCEMSEVQARWGLWPLVNIVNAGLFSEERAVDIVQAMAEGNPRLTSAIVNDFRKRIMN